MPLPTQPKVVSITQPFGFKYHLKALKQPDYAFPFVLIILIGLGFFLRGSDFLVAPGLTIVLPTIESPQSMSLPVNKVITLMDQQMLLFEGGVYTLGELEKQWQKAPEKGKLLLKCDKAAAMETVLRVCELARKSGFDGVQLAANQHSNQTIPFIDI